jgi:hypothetical protein
MVTPNQKRVAVAHLVAEFGVSKPSVSGGQPTPQQSRPIEIIDRELRRLNLGHFNLSRFSHRE